MFDDILRFWLRASMSKTIIQTISLEKITVFSYVYAATIRQKYLR